MPRSGLVADYLDALAHEMRFDAELARCVRAEVEDHLLESAAEASGEPGSADAQRRAIARFGDPRAIARQYAPGALLNQTRRVGTVVLVALVGISFTMKGRAAWYGLMEWAISDELKAIGAIGFSVDYVAFLLSIGLAIVSWFYIGSCRAPGEFRDDYGRQLMRCGLLCAATALALVTAVGADGLMTGLRLHGRDPSAAVLIPLVSMAAEVTFAIVLVRAIWTAMRRVAIAATLLRPSSID